MLYHCGLLDEQPERSRTLQWIRRGRWDQPGFPEDVRRELMIWLAMPGFAHSFHTRAFMTCNAVLRPYLDGFEQWKEEVSANWISATREDCIRLALMRPGKADVPLISQLQAVRDLKAGMTRSEVAREYRVLPETVRKWADGHFAGVQRLPSSVGRLLGNLNEH